MPFRTRDLAGSRTLARSAASAVRACNASRWNRTELHVIRFGWRFRAASATECAPAPIFRDQLSSATRSVELPETAIALLREQLLARTHTEGLVFPAPKGGCIEATVPLNFIPGGK